MEDLRCFLDFMITIRLDFFTKKIMICENDSKNTKKRYHAKSLTKSTREDLLKRARNKKSRINTTKQQEELRKRRKRSEDENKLYFDIIQSRLFKDDFCNEKIDDVIEAIYKIRNYKYFYEFELCNGHTDFSMSSLQRDYNL